MKQTSIHDKMVKMHRMGRSDNQAMNPIQFHWKCIYKLLTRSDLTNTARILQCVNLAIDAIISNKKCEKSEESTNVQANAKVAFFLAKQRRKKQREKMAENRFTNKFHVYILVNDGRRIRKCATHDRLHVNYSCSLCNVFVFAVHTTTIACPSFFFFSFFAHSVRSSRQFSISISIDWCVLGAHRRIDRASKNIINAKRKKEKRKEERKKLFFFLIRFHIQRSCTNYRIDWHVFFFSCDRLCHFFFFPLFVFCAILFLDCCFCFFLCCGSRGLVKQSIRNIKRKPKNDFIFHTIDDQSIDICQQRFLFHFFVLRCIFAFTFLLLRFISFDTRPKNRNAKAMQTHSKINCNRRRKNVERNERQLNFIRNRPLSMFGGDDWQTWKITVFDWNNSSRARNRWLWMHSAATKWTRCERISNRLIKNSQTIRWCDAAK